MSILNKISGRFRFLTNKYEYEDYEYMEDIPQDISHIIEVISFVPDVPPSPHTVKEHEMIASWQNKFKEIMETVYARSN